MCWSRSQGWRVCGGSPPPPPPARRPVGCAAGCGVCLKEGSGGRNGCDLWQTDLPVNINNNMSQDTFLITVRVRVGQAACFCPAGEAFLLLVCLGAPSCLRRDAEHWSGLYRDKPSPRLPVHCPGVRAAVLSAGLSLAICSTKLLF